MVQLPSFFFSHARQDRLMRRSYLDKLFRDLTEAAAQLAGEDLNELKRKNQQLGVIDTEQVLQGENWDKKLGDRLRDVKVFVAIITPLYYKRPNCGRELFAFLKRSEKLNVDSNGALTDAENVLLIRWVFEDAYSLLPILALVSDTPADERDAPAWAAAIRQYRRNGMAGCVQGRYYGLLLNLFANRIRTMPDLAAGGPFSFATLEDAFAYDWKQHFERLGSSTVAAAPTGDAVAAAPRSLASIVAFYITNRSLTTDSGPSGFRNRVIREPLISTDSSSTTDPALADLLADVRAAALIERLSILQAVSEPAVPVGAEPLLRGLIELSNAGILTVLIIDPAIWPSEVMGSTSSAIEQIIRSPDWTGAVLLPTLGISSPPRDLPSLLKLRNLPARLYALSDPEQRTSAISQIFLNIRGRVLQARGGASGGAEHVPQLSASVRPAE
jgi:hypothetical protein